MALPTWMALFCAAVTGLMAPAGQTSNRMRERIRGNLAERGRMLAAMAHDLRTPLTRAQLRDRQAGRRRRLIV
jgi:signal transduction histidine kinase